MPHPEEGEQKKDFMKRCIPMLIDEGRERAQSSAICYSVWGRENKIGDTSEQEYQRKKKLSKNGKANLMLAHY